MSAGDFDVNGLQSIENLHRTLVALSSRIDELENELENEKVRRSALEKRLIKHDDRYGLLLDDILSLEDALEDLRPERGGVEPPERALPIMRLAWTYRTSPDSLRANERRAAVVWRHFFDVCSKTPSKYVLDSNDVGTILTAEEDSAPYRQTIRRVMDLVADLGAQFIELEKVDGRNALVIDRVAFDDLVEELSEEDSP